MKKVFFGLLLPVLLFSGCEDHEREEYSISSPQVIFFGNLVEVIVDPGNEKCLVVYEHWNRRRGDALHIPFGTATVHFPDRKVVVSDKGTGNHAIEIDGRKYALKDSSPVIRAGKGLSWTKGRFEQGTDRRKPTVWVYPLRGKIPELSEK